MESLTFSTSQLSIDELDALIDSGKRIELNTEQREAIVKCRTYLDEVVAKNDRVIYGINTGFGSLCDVRVSPSDLAELQRNLVLSHACGMGERVPDEIVKRMLLLKVIGLSKGHSGVQLETVERLLFFYNNDIFPVVYQQGSLGASGDLAPLAHLCLPLLGEGMVRVGGVEITGAQCNQQFGLTPIVLRSKEGLALLNGTQFMSAYASYAVSNAKQAIAASLSISALSLEAFDGRIEPFGTEVNAIRYQEGQIWVAAQMQRLLNGSQLISAPKAHVQDPYSFRCIPQVLGATKDALDYAEQIVTREINAVTDNPTIFPDEDLVVSAGNFHGQPLALAMDFLAIAMAELANIAERRVYKLIGGTRGLPAFLTPNPGLNSGLMIVQYACASIVSQNKQLCTPASVDTIDSSNGQEDHVSMGANAGTKLYRVMENVQAVLGIELLVAAQAMEFREVQKSSDVIKDLYHEFRKEVNAVREDVWMQPLMELSKNYIKKKKWKTN